jgi:glycosyltransferase involved in cell wall biosynthesis
VKILLLSPYSPHPTNSGASQRTALVLESLKELADVDLLGVGNNGHFPENRRDDLRESHNLIGVAEPLDWKHSPAGRFFARAFPRLSRALMDGLRHQRHSFAHDPRMLGKLERLVASNRYDAVVVRYLRPACRSGALQLKLPVFIDIDDVDIEFLETEVQRNYGSRAGQWIRQRNLRQLREIYPELVGRAARCWVPNHASRNYPGLGDAVWLPNIPFHVPQADSLPEPGRDIVFLGILNYKANVQGLDWFLSEVWPRIIKSNPSATLRIAGGYLDPERKERWSATPNVVVQGFVEKVADAYRGSAFTIAPIQKGSGTNIKVVESFANGRTCVATPFGHRGYEDTLIPGESLLVGKSPEEFADACIQLLANQGEAARLAAKGAQVVRDIFSREHFSSVVRKTVLEHR